MLYDLGEFCKQGRCLEERDHSRQWPQVVAAAFNASPQPVRELFSDVENKESSVANARSPTEMQTTNKCC